MKCVEHDEREDQGEDAEEIPVEILADPNFFHEVLILHQGEGKGAEAASDDDPPQEWWKVFGWV